MISSCEQLATVFIKFIKLCKTRDMTLLEYHFVLERHIDFGTIHF
jgi:hypothetical protein